MATKTISDEPAVRKSLIYVGVAAVAAVVGFFLVSHFLLGGSSNTPLPSVPALPHTVSTVPNVTPAPTPGEETSGGSDPFSHPVGMAPAPAQVPVAATPAASVLASTQVNPHFTLSVAQVTGTAANLTFNGKAISAVHAGDKLPDGVVVQKVASGCAQFSQGGKLFSVCQGQTVNH